MSVVARRTGGRCRRRAGSREGGRSARMERGARASPRGSARGSAGPWPGPASGRRWWSTPRARRRSPATTRPPHGGRGRERSGSSRGDTRSQPKSPRGRSPRASRTRAFFSVRYRLECYRGRSNNDTKRSEIAHEQHQPRSADRQPDRRPRAAALCRAARQSDACAWRSTRAARTARPANGRRSRTTSP